MPHLLHEYHVNALMIMKPPIASWGLSMQRWLFYLLGTFLSRRFVIQLESSGEEDTYNGEWEQGNNSEWLKRYLWTVDCVSYEGQQRRNRMHINTIQSHFLEETEQTELGGDEESENRSGIPKIIIMTPCWRMRRLQGRLLWNGWRWWGIRSHGGLSAQLERGPEISISIINERNYIISIFRKSVTTSSTPTQFTLPANEDSLPNLI